MPTVTVRFFARYAELAGRDSIALAVPTAATVGDVLARVRQEIPEAGALPDRPLTALNLRQVKLDAQVKEGDDVALLPPLAGG
jgi:molybdopterin converting factor small subunit